MKIELQEAKDERTPEAKAFEAGWFAQLDNLKIYLPESKEYKSSEWFDYQYDLMYRAFTDFITNEQIQKQTDREVPIGTGEDSSGTAEN